MRPLELPPGWASGVELVPQTIGESGAWVLACRSLERNYGAAAIPAFLAAYGVEEPDRVRL